MRYVDTKPIIEIKTLASNSQVNFNDFLCYVLVYYIVVSLKHSNFPIYHNKVKIRYKISHSNRQSNLIKFSH